MQHPSRTTLIMFILAGGLCCSSETPSTSPGIRWVAYQDEILEAARSTGRPVILEFTAEWCPPCKELEERTFSDEAVVQAAQSFVAVRADVTDYDSAESTQLRSRFAVSGVPEILFLNGRGEEVKGTRVIGFIGPADFLRRLQFALSDSSELPPVAALEQQLAARFRTARPTNGAFRGP